VTFAVQRQQADGTWVDDGDYPYTGSTAIKHARERTKYDGVSRRAIVRETDQVLASFQATGYRHGTYWQTTKLTRVKP
jgi:hypothetical protein